QCRTTPSSALRAPSPQGEKGSRRATRDDHTLTAPHPCLSRLGEGRCRCQACGVGQSNEKGAAIEIAAPLSIPRKRSCLCCAARFFEALAVVAVEIHLAQA